ncbi:gliding motility-associated C-terminal domain-containing protein [Salegentibacter sp. T436]|uniref:gliding motility-associated C-terminal domain-containing protein n=1 Tax=Salegentibacter sp. T436 TaxID=1729720 RepID=UPI00094A500B|nr:gliding motility-associated C-terminal domain-containing protein [Salegentibacter sp. T436]APS37701.1 hypothetical protein AO058_01865 [Salegentibacter sp. T436]
MQNFTFGRKGTNWFLFAFVLLIGTLPSFGQEDCPEAGDFPATQDFCYLETIDDLDTDGNPVFQTNQVGDNQPIPGDELLEGTTYYIGGEDCAPENRLPLEVNVTSAPRPVNQITESRTQGFEFTTCASEDFDSEDLASLFEADTDYVIEVYESEFGETPYNGVLNPGGSYFVGQVSTGNDCPSLRTAVGFNPNEIEGPDAEATQTFCEEATVADLVAEGTYDDTQAIRWYRSQTANSPISAGTQLINGVTYFAAQVVNERGSVTPPCETPSGERTPVEVTLEEPEIINTVNAEVCVDDIMENPDADDFEGFFLNLIGNPGAGTFDPIPADLVAQYETNPIDTFTTTYTIDGECEAITASVTVLDTETANAGTFDPITLDCEAETFYDLTQLSNNDPNYTEGGTFSGEGVENNQFDTSSAAGEYTITYTVDDSIECVEGEDFTEFTITLTGEPQESEPILVNLCEDEVDPNPSTFEVNAYLRNLISSRTTLDEEAGTFNPSPAEIRQQFEDQNGLGNLTTTYTVATDCGEATVDIDIEISELLPANAGDFDNITIACDAPESVDLSNLENLDEEANLDGTFTGEGVENNQFNPSEVGPGTYPITYNVDDSGFCVVAGTSDSVTFDIIVEEASSSEVSRTLCVSEAEELLANPVQAIALFNELLEEQGDDIPSDGEFTPGLQSVIGDISAYLNNPTDEETFNTVYTYGDEDCQSSIEIALTIQEDQEANAGSFNDVTIFCDSEQTIDLTTLENLDPDASTGGTFSGVGVENNQFDASGLEADTYAITYSVDESADCVIAGTSSSTTFDITVESEVENIAPINVSLCEDEVQDDPSTFEVNAYLRNLVRARTNLNEDDGTFNPTPAEIRQQFIATDGIGIFETTYTVATEECGDTTVDINIEVQELQAAEAGEFDDITIACEAEDMIDLTELTNLDENANSGGTFTGEGVENNQFNTSEIGPGTYTITYFVDDSADCVIEGTSDSVTFDITIESGVQNIEPINITLCENEVEDDPSAPGIREFLLAQVAQNSDLDLDGDFNPTPAEIRQQYIAADGIGVFETTYTLETEECGVTSLDINIEVQELQAAEAGEIDNITLNCFNTGIIILDDSILDENANTGGTFTAEEGVLNEDGNFDPSIGAGTYTITYNVNDSADCVIEGTSDSTSFDIIVSEDLEALNPVSVILCEDEVQDNPTEVQIRSFFTNLVANNTSLDSGGNFDPSPAEILTQFENQNGLGIFETEYTVDTGDCGIVSVMLTAEVTPLQQADAGEFSDIEICTTDDEIQLSAGQTDGIEGGFFTIDGEVIEGGIFNPTIMEEGDYDVTYTINEDTACVEGEASTSFTISIFEGPNAGSDLALSYCESEIEELIANPGEAQNFLITLLENQEEDVDLRGEFDANVEELFAYYNNGDFSQPFVATYTVANENCEDSAQISITINEIEEANAGEFDDYTFCTTDENIDLNNEITGTMGGMFTIEGEIIENGIFAPSTFEAGNYTVTYTVDENLDCVEGEDSTTFEIELIQGVSLGQDRTIELCINEIDPEPSVLDVRNYFRNLLGSNYSEDGTFEPSIAEIRTSFLENPIDTFTTTFSVGEGECSDSVELSVVVYALEEANAGEIEDLTICSTEEDIDLYSLISDEANENGYFEGYENGIFSPTMNEAGSYEITYVVDSTTACVEGEDSTTFTIEVQQGANAGEDMNVTVCSNDGQQDLFSLISADADTDGEFTLEGEVIADGIMDPSAFEVGTYEVIYTVTAGEDADCGGDDMSTITITLGEAPDAPTTGEAIAFCAIDGETAARLEADGTNLTWYSDADLTMMVSEEDLLVDGDYYVTQSSDEGCESEAAVLTVNIVDSPAPTISSNYELCEFDNPTIADLSAEINESGEVTWYDSADSMTALSNNATLTDGITYYATLISDNGCESSERLAVTVTLEDCALLFPEAITPNGDGRNDRFVIENIEREYPNFNITIFNRWGNAVYKGNASTPTWDGTSNQSGSLGDDVLPVGVYFYVVDFNDGSTEPRQGKVYLNR